MSTSMIANYRTQFHYYKTLADKAIAQLADEQVLEVPGAGSNSIAIAMKHVAGNMLSRWTDIWTTDGEKDWRHRDEEFLLRGMSVAEVKAYWEKGWECLMTTLDSLTDADLKRLIYIRNMGHTVQEAIVRQLCHYPYHVGQIVYIAKLLKGPSFQSLSIPVGKSESYNADKFAKDKTRKHFTEDL